MPSAPYPSPRPLQATANATPPVVDQMHRRSPSSENVCGRLALVESDIVSVMGTQVAPDLAQAKPGAPVQSNPATLRKAGTIYQATTPEQASAFRALRSVVGTLTERTAQAELGWSRDKARRWLAYFKAKGVLMATRSGHCWRAA